MKLYSPLASVVVVRVTGLPWQVGAGQGDRDVGQARLVPFCTPSWLTSWKTVPSTEAASMKPKSASVTVLQVAPVQVTARPTAAGGGHHAPDLPCAGTAGRCGHLLLLGLHDVVAGRQVVERVDVRSPSVDVTASTGSPISTRPLPLVSW